MLCAKVFHSRPPRLEPPFRAICGAHWSGAMIAGGPERSSRKPQQLAGHRRALLHLCIGTRSGVEFPSLPRLPIPDRHRHRRIVSARAGISRRDRACKSPRHFRRSVSGQHSDRNLDGLWQQLFSRSTRRRTGCVELHGCRIRATSRCIIRIDVHDSAQSALARRQRSANGSRIEFPTSRQPRPARRTGWFLNRARVPRQACATPVVDRTSAFHSIGARTRLF